MFTTEKECQDWIENIQKYGDKLDLKRMNIACEILGNPEKKLKTIHIGGTNGKGSTTSFLKNILMENGYSVGTFTSPYIIDFKERICLNNNMINKIDLIKYTNILYDVYVRVDNEYNEKITFFEILTLISFLYFYEKKPDFVIYEVGLGGRLDSTNVISPLVCGITNISYDHMHILGDTLEKIAFEKIGIVKEGIPLITTENNENIVQVFTDQCILLSSKLKVINTSLIKDISILNTTSFTYLNEKYELKMIGVHQVKNATLAIELANELVDQKFAFIDTNLLNKALLNTFWPGRFEIFDNVILDGAHNIGGINVLKDSILKKYPDKKIISLTCIMDNKEKEKVIEIIESFSTKIYFTTFDYYRTTTAKALYDLSNHKDKYYNENYIDAFTNLKKQYNNKDEIILITGSLYFISVIRKLILA